MPTKDLKLTNIDEETFTLPQDSENINKWIFFLDPAVLRRVKVESVINIARINILYRVKVAKLEAQMKEAEAEALAAVEKELAKHGK